MKRATALPLFFLLLAAGVQGATVNTTLTVTNAAFALSTTTGTASASGNATLTGLGANGATLSGTFSSSISLTAITGATVTPAFTLTFSGGTLTGTLSIPTTALTGSGPLTGSATISGGTGSYAGYTGTFSSLTGTTSGSITSTLTLTFTGAGTINTSGSTGGTGGTGGGSTAPTITAVLDAASNTAGIAQGSIFIVKGSNLAPSGFVQTGFPLPAATSNGVGITFTPAAGGSGTAAYMIYTCNTATYGCVNNKTQLAAILPSTLAAGSYNVTVTSNGSTSAPFSASVVARKFEMFTQDSTGTGLAVVQNYVSASELDINRFTTGVISGITISPAKPNEPVIVWGTGMGGVTFADNTGSPGYDFSKNGVNVQAIVGGVSVPVAYAGRTATLAGEDEVVFTLPATIPTGCTVSLQISVNGALSAPTFISIAPGANSSGCVQPGVTAAQLQSLDNGGTINFGGFGINQIQETVPSVGSIKVDSVSGGFNQITGFQLASAAQYTIFSAASTGACQVITVSGNGSVLVGGNLTGLDAGAVSLNGPSGSGISSAALSEDATSHTYNLSLGDEGLGVTVPGSLNATLVAGQYTLTGSGGNDVGSFSVSLNLGTPFTLSAPLPATVNRSSNLALSWTGGNSSDIVEIIGFSGTTSGSGANSVTTATEFLCSTTAGPGQFSVPASVLMQLPPTASAATGGTGFLEIESGPTPTSFNPALKSGSGGTISSVFSALLGTGGLVTYQ